jgi:cyclopropane-fatty-acyl-phospholipid synthase
MAEATRPFYEDVQSHYDLSDDFFKLFLDPSRTYSCAYFRDEGMTLAEAQLAKIDLSLGKCDLRPGQTLLDVGCGWGATARRAAEKYGVRVIGLTLSRNQQQHASTLAASKPELEFRLQGWEEFDQPVDRIVSIGAMEHFRIERYPAFFERCRKVLPRDGRMLLHLIVQGNRETLQPGQPEFDEDLVTYIKFIKKHIFPGGQVPPREVVVSHAEAAGFKITQIQSLRPHYARTLDQWAANLEAARDAAVAITSQVIYDRYMFYLTRSAHYFRTGHCDVVQFTCEVA